VTSTLVFASLWIFTLLLAWHQRNVYLRTTSNRIKTLELMLSRKNHELDSLRKRVANLESRLGSTRSPLNEP
jgi:hypothetical protein